LGPGGSVEAAEEEAAVEVAAGEAAEPALWWAWR
jgi:hypothetical protein